MDLTEANLESALRQMGAHVAIRPRFIVVNPRAYRWWMRRSLSRRAFRRWRGKHYASMCAAYRSIVAVAA